MVILLFPKLCYQQAMKIIGIAGGSGSGKTTFAKKVISFLPEEQINILHMDSYYLENQPLEHYTKSGRPNFDHPEAFDWKLLSEHLIALKNGESIEVPVYNFKTSKREEKSSPMKAKPILIFEGIFTLFDQNIREILDIKTFLHVEADIRFTRRLNRDVQERGRSLDSVTKQYYETVRPMYEKFLAPQKNHADFIVGEETDIASQILAARIKEFISSYSSFEFLLDDQGTQKENHDLIN